MGHSIRAIIGAPQVVARARDFGLLDPRSRWKQASRGIPVVDVRLDELAETSSLPPTDFDRRLMIDVHARAGLDEWTRSGSGSTAGCRTTDPRRASAVSPLR